MSLAMQNPSGLFITSCEMKSDKVGVAFQILDIFIVLNEHIWILGY